MDFSPTFQFSIDTMDLTKLLYSFSKINVLEILLFLGQQKQWQLFSSDFILRTECTFSLTLSAVDLGVLTMERKRIALYHDQRHFRNFVLLA